MHLISEYCEIHLDPNLAPHRWLFRSNEPVCIQFGVLLAKQPEQGLVWVEANNGDGDCQQQVIDVEAVSIYSLGDPCQRYQFFTATLPPLSQGGYHYRIGYYDRDGGMHRCRQVRTILMGADALSSQKRPC